MNNKKDSEKKWSQLIVKAWTDEHFKKRLIEHPEQVFKEYNLFPNVKHPKIVENSENVTYIALPKKPSRNLTKQDLEDLAAGEAMTLNCC